MAASPIRGIVRDVYKRQVYTHSDPRSEILKAQIEILAQEKNLSRLYQFYRRTEELAKQVILRRKGIHVSSNIDFYSGLVYSMLDIPEDCYSPLFAASRMVGWLAHNIENKLYCDKIVRPAGKMCIRDRFDDQDRRDGFHFLPANGQTPDRLRRSLKTARRQTCWPSPPGLQRRESGNPPDSFRFASPEGTVQRQRSFLGTLHHEKLKMSGRLPSTFRFGQRPPLPATAHLRHNNRG